MPNGYLVVLRDGIFTVSQTKKCSKKQRETLKRASLPWCVHRGICTHLLQHRLDLLIDILGGEAEFLVEDLVRSREAE